MNKRFALMLLVCTITWVLPGKLRAQGWSAETAPTAGLDLPIPPLAVILDSAIASNPMVKFRDQGIVGKESNLTHYKNYWTRNLGVQADVRYGTFNNFSTNTSEGQTPSYIATNTSQTVYGVGVYIKFPLQDIVDRRNQITMAKSELDQARSMAEAQRKELVQLVIAQYNDVILKQRILVIKSKNLSASKVNMDMVETQFHNGVISVAEYTRITDIVSDVQSEFETARTDFITAYMILEEIAGFQFDKSI